jgi:hypothetical protein
VVHVLDYIMRPREKATKEFEFVEAGRKFFCSIEVPRHAGMRPWWWFHLDTATSTRYAPFEASENDTRESVQARILAYYAELLAIEARPAYQRPVWQKPERTAPIKQISST